MYASMLFVVSVYVFNNKNMKLSYPAITVSWGDNSAKNWWNAANSNPKPDLHNIKAHIKFGENPLRCTQVIVLKQKYGRSWADNSVKT